MIWQKRSFQFKLSSHLYTVTAEKFLYFQTPVAFNNLIVFNINNLIKVFFGGIGLHSWLGSLARLPYWQQVAACYLTCS